MSIHSADGATYDDHGRLLKNTHSSVANRESPDPDVFPTVYVAGDDDTEDSIRLILGDDDITHVERRIDGVWNATELELGSDTLFLGHNLSLSAVGEILQVKSVDGDKQFLVLDVENSDEGTGNPRTPRADVRNIRLIIQPDISVEITSTQHTREVNVQSNAGFARNLYLTVGSIAASEDVTVNINLGLTGSDGLVFTRNYPASAFPANTEILISMAAGAGLIFGEEALLSIESTAEFSLLGDGVDFFFGLDFQRITSEELVMESAIFNNDLGHVLDSTLDPVYTNPVFV